MRQADGKSPVSLKVSLKRIPLGLETKFVYESANSYTKFVYDFTNFVYEIGNSYTNSNFVYEIRLRGDTNFVDELRIRNCKFVYEFRLQAKGDTFEGHLERNGIFFIRAIHPQDLQIR